MKLKFDSPQGKVTLNMGQIVKILKAKNLPVVKARVYRAKKKWTTDTVSANLATLRAAGLVDA